MSASLGLITSTAEGVEVRNLLTFLSPFLPRGALIFSLARWWYSFLFQLMARFMASWSSPSGELIPSGFLMPWSSSWQCSRIVPLVASYKE